MTRKHIGKLISAAREKRKLTVPDLGGLCRVTRSSVYNWEAARFILPKNFKRLAPALGMSIKRLEAENGKDKRKRRSTNGRKPK